MLYAKIIISDRMYSDMDPSSLKDYVERVLADRITEQILNQYVKPYMIIETETDPVMHTKTFRAAYNPIGAITGNTINTNPISAGSVTFGGHDDVLLMLRVVEYTKKDKLTRVELQSYDKMSDTWIKVPRVQIEEE
jgi:hypothetical protein